MKTKQHIRGGNISNRVRKLRGFKGQHLGGRRYLPYLLVGAVVVSSTPAFAAADNVTVSKVTLDCSKGASSRVVVDLHVGSDPLTNTGWMALYGSATAATTGVTDGSWALDLEAKTKFKVKTKRGKTRISFRVSRGWKAASFTKKQFKAVGKYVKKSRCKKVNLKRSSAGKVRFFQEPSNSTLPVNVAEPTTDVVQPATTSVTDTSSATETATVTEPVTAAEPVDIPPSFDQGTLAGLIEFNDGSDPDLGIDEASGIVASQAHPGVLWVNNDHDGDYPEGIIFAMSTTGEYLGTYYIDGAENVDYEDITLGPKTASFGGGFGSGSSSSSEGDYIYVGDIGDNDGDRHDSGGDGTQVYRFPEPDVSVDQTPGVFHVDASDVTTLDFEYDDGLSHNAESLAIDPLTKALYIITKVSGAHGVETNSEVFKISSSEWSALYMPRFSGGPTATKVGELPYSWISSGEISPDGSEFILKRNEDSYESDDKALLFQRSDSESEPWDTLFSAGQEIPAVEEPNSEGITFDGEGSGFFSTGEGESAPIYYYARF